MAVSYSGRGSFSYKEKTVALLSVDLKVRHEYEKVNNYGDIVYRQFWLAGTFTCNFDGELDCGFGQLVFPQTGSEGVYRTTAPLLAYLRYFNSGRHIRPGTVVTYEFTTDFKTIVDRLADFGKLEYQVSQPGYLTETILPPELRNYAQPMVLLEPITTEPTSQTINWPASADKPVLVKELPRSPRRIAGINC